ncbi:class III lanthipeptide [Lysobacter enzymogenes]|nr:class III lanthipeptide [Lysobacter enzymogenes]QQP94141.1 class III lanthipeptide [Lysobacter enzymogenes]
MDRILKLQELPTYNDQQQPGDSTATSGSTSSCNACVCETIPTAV